MSAMFASFLSFNPAFPRYAEAQNTTSLSVSSASQSAVSVSKVVPVLITYRSSSLASRLSLEGARLRLTNEPGVTVTEVDLDGVENGVQNSADGASPAPAKTTDVRRKLSDSGTKILLALEPSLDPGFPPLIDSLGLTVVATGYLEGVISPSTRGLFSLYPRISGVRDAIERFFITQPNIKNFGVICSNSRRGIQYSELWREVATARGIKVPVPDCGNEQSFDSRVTLLRAKGQQIDGFGVGFGILNVISRLRDMSWPRPLLLSASQGEELLFDTTQDRAGFPEIFFDAPVYSEVFARAFAQKYEERSPTLSNALGYEAVTVVLKALMNGGDTVAGIRKLSYNGVSGPIDFTVENTGNGAKSVLMRIEGIKAVRIH